METLAARPKESATRAEQIVAATAELFQTAEDLEKTLKRFQLAA
jgi:hypothetical protein